MQANVPGGSVDTHVHVFDPRYPFAPGRSYTPGPAPLTHLLEARSRLGVERLVLVQPSVYGSDNAALLDALTTLGPERARGVAVVNDDVTGSQLGALADAGIVGLRLNVQSDPRGRGPLRGPLSRLMEQAAPAGLFVQVFASYRRLAEVADVIAASPVPVVLDHFGGIKADSAGLEGVEDVTALLRKTHVWVKLSGAYRCTTDPSPTAALADAVDAYLAAAPDRLVWATDWPHTGGGAERAGRSPQAIEPFRAINDHAELQALLRLIATPDQIRNVLVDNPARLCRFDQTA